MGAAEASRLQSKLRADAGHSETRAVSNPPRDAVIRYFFTEDAAAAEAVAADLRGSGTEWPLQDFTSNRPKPPRGPVAVWPPRPE